MNGPAAARTPASASRIDPRRFGPWAVVTGASSGIGREFARQLAASGIHVVLVARRESLLREVGAEISREFGVNHRVVRADLSRPDFMREIVGAIEDIDVGLVVSNAGTAQPGEFRKLDHDVVTELFRLNALSHLEIAHYFGRRLAARGRGGIILCGAMGASHGIPYMANDSASKAYVETLGEALHVELKPAGVNVTVLVVGPTQTAIIDKFGLTPETMPMKPMSTRQCVAEALDALRRNRPTHLNGRVNRIMRRLIPTSLSRAMMGSMIAKALAAQGRAVTS